MRTLNRSRPHTATPNRVARRQPGSDRPRGRRPTPQLIADGVITGYIREISRRGSHLRAEPEAPAVAVTCTA